MTQYLQKSLGLNKSQLAAIDHLEASCNQFDGLSMKLNPNTLRARQKDEINDFLYYVNEELIAYLALYSFNAKEVEVNAMTHPDYRRQGIFKQLLAAAREEVRKRYVPDFLFICEQASPAAAPVMQAIGAIYDFSEYKMTLTRAPSSAASMPGLHLRLAKPEDIEALTHMDVQSFGTDPGVAKTWIEKALASNNRRVWVALLNESKIGKIQISQSGEETFINAFCVLSEHRSRGYGKVILNRIVAQLVDEQHPLISLEVETKNENALSLYKQAGFEIITAYDYYRLPVG